MEYRAIGKTGIQVSHLCFGTMSFGGDADEDTSKAMYKRCREAGINFFDTKLNTRSYAVTKALRLAVITRKVLFFVSYKFL